MAPVKRPSEEAPKANGTRSKKAKTSAAAPAPKRSKTAAAAKKNVENETSDESDDGSWDGFDEDDVKNQMDMAEEGAVLDANAGPDMHPDRKANSKSFCSSHRLYGISSDKGLATTSREAHAKQKQVVRERKAAKPNADMLLRSKKLWERLRRKSHVPLEERNVLVTELFEILTNRVKDFVFKHDAVRVVQTGVKYAKPPQRKMIAMELKGHYRQLAESRYAKFLIGKLLVKGYA
jgi:pumilio family protein 6